MISTMQTTKKALKMVASILFWIVVWHIAATITNKNLLIPIPTPFSTFNALVVGLKESTFYLSAVYSVVRIAIGFLLALFFGTVLGILSSKIELLDTLFSPLLKVIRAIPVVSFIILVFLWMKRDSVPTFIAFLTVLPIIWTNVKSGINATDKQLIEIAKVMGMKRGAILKNIVIPQAFPFISSAISTGLGFAWKSGVAAEVICRTQNSLGNLLSSEKSIANYDDVFAVTVIVVILSVIFEYSISSVLKRRMKK